VHPGLARFIPLVQRLWPDAHLRLVTNGFFLHRHPDLPVALAAHPDAAIYLSLHHGSEAYLEKVRPVVALLQQWQAQYGVRAGMYPSASNWTRRYHGHGAAMQPFQDQEPRSSWEQCPARTCPQVLDGAIYKCAPLAYLPMQDAKFGLSPAWTQYLGYQPLRPDCDDAELAAFFDREEEPSCGMCPARPQRFDLPLPLRRAPGPSAD
jgi:hypothetical protein